MVDVDGRVFATDSCLVTYIYMYVTGGIDVAAMIRGSQSYRDWSYEMLPLNDWIPHDDCS